jgi:hypothetical protein
MEYTIMSERTGDDSHTEEELFPELSEAEYERHRREAIAEGVESVKSLVGARIKDADYTTESGIVLQLEDGRVARFAGLIDIGMPKKKSAGTKDEIDKR